jgi:hypothetical protein
MAVEVGDVQGELFQHFLEYSLARAQGDKTFDDGVETFTNFGSNQGS